MVSSLSDLINKARASIVDDDSLVKKASDSDNSDDASASTSTPMEKVGESVGFDPLTGKVIIGFEKQTLQTGSAQEADQDAGDSDAEPAAGAATTTDLQSILDELGLKGSGLSFKYAMLQLQQANSCKEKADALMEQIEEIQKKQTKVAEMIAEARKLQKDATSKNKTEMSSELYEFYKSYGLDCQGTSTTDSDGNATVKCTSDDWTYNLESLTNYQESISNQTQTLMIYLQDAISQYNNYLQGSSTSITTGTQTTQKILTSI